MVLLKHITDNFIVHLSTPSEGGVRGGLVAPKHRHPSITSSSPRRAGDTFL